LVATGFVSPGFGIPGCLPASCAGGAATTGFGVGMETDPGFCEGMGTGSGFTVEEFAISGVAFQGIGNDLPLPDKW
jgi:hypothetical protein